MWGCLKKYLCKKIELEYNENVKRLRGENGGFMMRVYENDRAIKIPNWYLKLPQKVLNCISDIAIFISHLVTREHNIKRTNKKNIKFYL